MKFSSYCWNIGTTSFRVKELNLKIEQQLGLLEELRKEHSKMSWQELEQLYFDAMVEKEFTKNSLQRKAKEKIARQKTSSLVDLGLVTRNRHITKVGQKLQMIMESEKYTGDNIFQLNEDSYLYLKQFLKYQTTGGSNQFQAKPMIILLCMLNHLEYLTVEEFMYFLPLCINTKNVYETIDEIKQYRQGVLSIDEMMNHKILGMQNYRECLDYMLSQDMNSLDEFVKVEMNRKGSQYSKSYHELYLLLEQIYEKQEVTEQQADVVLSFLMKEYKKNIKTGKVWRDYFQYKRSMKSPEMQNILIHLPLMTVSTKEEFQKEFFLLMTRAKWKANLADYYDLNRRYFLLTDIFLFQEDRIRLDLLPKFYFKKVADQLVDTPFLEEKEYIHWFEEDLPIDQIYEPLGTDMEEVHQQMKENMTIRYELEKMERFQELIERQFSTEQLIQLLTWFQEERYEPILNYCDWSANPPTIFEYVIGIAWYRICGRRYNILESMRLSLDANLYPKSHATGGDADLICNYLSTDQYHSHTVLLEATLTKSTNQRKSEMEPVSRHMMRYLQETEEEHAYALFIAPYLHEEVLSDFRNKKTYQYRGKDGVVRQGLHIVALGVEDLILLLKTNTSYETIYSIFQKAIYDTEINDLDWYQEMIQKPIHANSISFVD